MIPIAPRGMRPPWLLSGPDANWRPEPLSSHAARLGPVPASGRRLIEEIEKAGLRGRGGAGFPVAVKWKAVADRSHGRAALIVNGAEGEPLSLKDHLLLASRPHLVLDGAQLAAQSVGAREVYLYVGRHHPAAMRSLEQAVRERGGLAGLDVELVEAPVRFVAGEETAAVRLVNGGEAKPTGVPPRPFEQGVKGRPTLVNNVETLAQAALIARYGSEWFRSAGTAETPGTMLVTVAGQVAAPGVHEVDATTRIGDVIAPKPGHTRGPLLLGGYFGSWVRGSDAAELTFDSAQLAGRGLKLGAGVLFTLAAGDCGVAATARIVGYLAGESARQCGPCQFGLADLSRLLSLLAEGRGRSVKAGQLERWIGQLSGGRGACHHPDGALGLIRSAIAVFSDDFEAHLRRGACAAAFHDTGLPVGLGPQAPWR
ncbi:MAG TPA: NADH-ubiquinone oxidoreductase-F iron-sulfur binding region domain-containing protein [Candidatus Dormibacteraeota bacterium]|nr:NADH-ubiquinone oxidoreductase-F iron-sulfur binding region domain-containing protein [Candidatus Dormibacteraeota bacterium]